MEREKIIEKVKHRIHLTREEELFYLTNIAGYTTEEANTIIEIAQNKDENVLID